MTTYRYLLANLLTNQILAELDLTGVNFTQQLNSAGTLSANILLSGMTNANNAAAATTPGQTAIYVDRNGVIVWGGVIWSRTYNSTSQHISISAQEFESYLSRRRISSTLSYYGKDQLFIARDLVAQGMAQPYGNIGINIPPTTSGIISDPTIFYGYELRTYLAALQDLAKAGTGSSNGAGFDFAITCAYDGQQNITNTLRLGYPMLGTRYSSTSATAPVFEYPAGNIVEYEASVDGSRVANKIYVTGAGSNEGKLIYSAADVSKLQQGWALLEDSTSYSNWNSATTLQNLANGQVAATSYPPTQLKVIANPATDPIFGSYVIGDDVRIRIKDFYYPDGIDATYRLVALTVTPGETGPERVTLSLTLPTTS